MQFPVYKRKKDSLLWKITAVNFESWLYGTMHVKDQRAFKFLHLLHGYVDRSEHFYAEMDLAESEKHLDPRAYLIPGNRDLLDLLGEHKYRKARKIILKTGGLDLDHFRRMLPILVSNMIMENMLADDHRLALDHELWKYARQSGIATGGIETYQEQLILLGNIPMELQSRHLLKVSNNLHALHNQANRLAELYRKGKIHRLFRVTADSMGGLRRNLIYERNFRMAHRINRIARRENAFIAVGAGHLSGKYGLIHLLKEKGLEVRPEPLFGK